MEEKFKFHLPIEIKKSLNSNSNDEEKMTFKGIASTPEEDTQSEFLDPSGMDLSAFEWVNWNHLGTKDPSTLIGRIVKALITPKNELYVEGELFPKIQKAKDTWELMKQLVDYGMNLGISVEGKVIKRGSEDKNNPLFNRIIKSKITSIALCPTPINTGTWAGILKGELYGDIEDKYDEKTEKIINDIKTNILNKGLVNKILTKSEIFEIIFNKCDNIDLTKSIYKLIEKITEMNKKEITQEQIDKAFDLLDITKGVKNKTLKKDDNNDNDNDEEEDDDDDKEDDDDDKENDDDDKEMVEKAFSIGSSLLSKGRSEKEIQQTLIKKGFNEAVINKSIKKINYFKTNNPVQDDLLKSLFEENLVLNKKISAIGSVFEIQMNELNELKKSIQEQTSFNGQLLEEIKKIGNTPIPHKSIINKSFIDKFEKDKEDNVVKYSLSNKEDRRTIINTLNEISEEQLQINKAISQEILNTSAKLEVSGLIESQRAVNLLKQKGIEITN